MNVLLQVNDRKNLRVEYQVNYQINFSKTQFKKELSG